MCAFFHNLGAKSPEMLPAVWLQDRANAFGRSPGILRGTVRGLREENVGEKGKEEGLGSIGYAGMPCFPAPADRLAWRLRHDDQGRYGIPAPLLSSETDWLFAESVGALATPTARALLGDLLEGLEPLAF